MIFGRPNKERQNKVAQSMPTAALVNILLYVVSPLLIIAFIILSPRILQIFRLLIGRGS